MKNQEFMRFTLWFDVEKIGYTTMGAHAHAEGRVVV